jgi:hypothetical protein
VQIHIFNYDCTFPLTIPKILTNPKMKPNSQKLERSMKTREVTSANSLRQKNEEGGDGVTYLASVLGRSGSSFATTACCSCFVHVPGSLLLL